MGEAKIELKLKGVEVFYQGPSEYLGTSLKTLCEDLLALDAPELNSADAGKSEANESEPNEPKNVKLSTTDIAVELGSKTGPELVMAAAAHLRFSKDKDEFSRSELLTEMKSAKSFFKTTYRNNLSKSLDGLVKSKRLSNPGTDKYALPHSEEVKLSNALDI